MLHYAISDALQKRLKCLTDWKLELEGMKPRE